MKFPFLLGSLLLLPLLYLLPSCCGIVSFKAENQFWYKVFEEGEQIIFKSDQGNYDTLYISAVDESIPTGECNYNVSTDDRAFAKVDYRITREGFELSEDYLVQLTERSPETPGIPVIRWLNMEFHSKAGDGLGLQKIDYYPIGTTIACKDCFLFNARNCGINYDQDFGMVEFVWSKQEGLLHYRHRTGELWTRSSSINRGNE